MSVPIATAAKYIDSIDAGDAFVDRLKKKTPCIGGFNAMYPIPEGYEKPVLVSGTDGVGTKINIANLTNTWNTIGIDLVAMCVNDVICCGADPLYFLDYISCEKIDDRLDKIMEGVIKGCEIAGVELVGGETAEHGRFAKDIDLAGFCTGIVEGNDIIAGQLIHKGDKIIGLPSSGLHSNGYTLINDLLWRHKLFLQYRDKGDEDEGIGKELLTPTTIYAQKIKEIRKEIPVLGMAHITGGGIPGNLSRCIPEHLTAHIDYTSWVLPPIFSKIQLAGEIPEEQMKRIFNLGIGFCLIVPSEIKDLDENQIGVVV